MKNITLSTFAITFLIILFGLTTAPAADRVKIFEMGESGLNIEFPVTVTETAGSDSAIAGSTFENEDLGI